MPKVEREPHKKGDYLGDYEGISREDDGFRASAEVQYRLNRFLHVNLRYKFDSRRSNVSGQDFNRSRIDLGVEFQI